MTHLQSLPRRATLHAIIFFFAAFYITVCATLAPSFAWADDVPQGVESETGEPATSLEENPTIKARGFGGGAEIFVSHPSGAVTYPGGGGAVNFFYQFEDVKVITDLSFSGGKRFIEDMESDFFIFHWTLGAQWIASPNASSSFYAGGGLSFSYLDHSTQQAEGGYADGFDYGYTRQDAVGVGLVGDIGYEFLRDEPVHLNLHARVVVPTMPISGYDGESTYIVPVSLGLGLNF